VWGSVLRWWLAFPQAGFSPAGEYELSSARLRLSAVNIKLIPPPIFSSALLPPLLASLWPGARFDLTPLALVVWGMAGALLFGYIAGTN